MQPNEIPFPTSAPPPQRTHRWITLLHLDGREWASAGFTGGRDVWGWIVETVVWELGCNPETVHCEEDPDGLDLVTVDGLPCYRIAHRPPLL